MKYNMSDDFRGHEDMKVPLPKAFGSIAIPELFIVHKEYKTGEYERDANGKFKMKKVAHKSRSGKITYTMEQIPILKEGWFIDRNLLNNEVLNKTRNISSRDKRKLIELYTTKIDKITPSMGYIPRLKDFPSMEERRIIYDYLTHLDLDEEVDYPHNKTRGLPPILPKNWKHHNLGKFPKGYEAKEEKNSHKEVSHEDIFGSDTESESDKDEEATPSKKSAGGGKIKGRPRKHKTEEEAYLAKIKSNKDKRAERRLEERRNKIKEKLEKGEKLTKKERELHETEGEGIDFEEIKWGTFKALYNRFLKNNPNFKDKIEDLEHFAHFVVENPEKFSKIALKKAQFYVNILEHKSEGGKLSKIGQSLNKIFNPTKNGFVNKNKVNYSNDTLTNNDFK
jgi:hypothetical protein